ncbi:HVO_A0114 family putative DNA-binding protein [Methanobrevibacter filiformis]|uniref:Uncharacterized protein n=1 Tax=Methanobrevibacter filiformis TaxID=55758 RepID=A0A162FEP5_9EURY|nr:hypothetical protein [Methanobrevibacter filiformis]KZX11945.1 hypothetical protein MBFIL_12830 [Methanobrevibacter filiformis]
MMISLNKHQTGKEFIKEMEKTYGSIKELEKKFKIINKMIYHVDLEAWKYHKDNLDETIDRTTSIITDSLTIGEIEIELLTTIKRKHPESIRELARLVNRDISVVQPKVKNLSETGLIELKEGIKNRKTPYLNYDEITIAI